MPACGMVVAARVDPSNITKKDMNYIIYVKYIYVKFKIFSYKGARVSGLGWRAKKWA